MIRSYTPVINARNGDKVSVYAVYPQPPKRNKYTGQIAVASNPGELVALDGSCYYRDGDAWFSIAGST